MKTIEFKPDGKPTIITPVLSPADVAARNDVLLEVLPLLFHKLKNKLTPILGYTQMLMARGSDEFARERLARIERNTAELSDELNVLKDYVLPGACRREPTDIAGLLESMAPEWQGIATAARARVVLELDPALPALELNPCRLRVLLLNLADNAASALQAKAPASGEIRVSARAEGNSLTLRVRDNGRGMDDEEMALAWTPFYSNFPGHAGLGLVLCEKIIADHGAACAVSSCAGEFSCFEIAFPPAAAGMNAKHRSQS
ncbi:MAG: HAMP domain-containing histidine kinase [Acidobacteria bacterium]|jgi:signal transduction histidine kinase|nr:HAMP domain-containing histidine kinase [Acidobacteriota bacterium]